MTRPMNDRTPEPTWKTVPTDPTPEMIEAGHAEYERALIGNRRDIAAAFRRRWAAMLAASPPAPAAEPVGMQWRYRGVRAGKITKWSEWTDGDDPELQAYGNLSLEIETRHLYTHPIDAAAIRAEARRAALEEAAAWHDDQASLHDAQGEACGTGSDGWKRHTVAAADHRRSAASVRALADKGEAEGWRPIATAPKDGTEIIGVFSCDYGYQEKPTVYGPWTIRFNGKEWISSWDGYQVISSETDFGTDYHGPDIEPTHWRPLPAPPAGGRDGE